MLQPNVNGIEIKLFEIRHGSPFDHLISTISKAPLTPCLLTGDREKLYLNILMSSIACC